jgi:hypothetical protein
MARVAKVSYDVHEDVRKGGRLEQHKHVRYTMRSGHKFRSKVGLLKHLRKLALEEGLVVPASWADIIAGKQRIKVG